MTRIRRYVEKEPSTDPSSTIQKTEEKEKGALSITGDRGKRGGGGRAKTCWLGRRRKEASGTL